MWTNAFGVGVIYSAKTVTGIDTLPRGRPSSRVMHCYNDARKLKALLFDSLKKQLISMFSSL